MTTEIKIKFSNKEQANLFADWLQFERDAEWGESSLKQYLEYNCPSSEALFALDNYKNYIFTTTSTSRDILVGSKVQIDPICLSNATTLLKEGHFEEEEIKSLVLFYQSLEGKSLLVEEVSEIRYLLSAKVIAHLSNYMNIPLWIPTALLKKVLSDE